ncbi:hypothetical protein JXD20_03000 [Candidatus Peregrinibacteria bacterium]|nr:hypothetical protein [Candidatus Peregrinibacteria bacterium]
MNLRRIKHTVLRLTAEEKVIGVGALMMLIGTFMPWYSVVMNFDNKSLSETGFSGDLGVIGFVIFIMSLISLLVLVAENMHLPLPQFGYKREQILFLFLGEAFFLTLLTMAIYTKRSLEFTEAGLRFGIYIVLLGAFFGALSAFALIQKKKKKEVQEFFAHEQEEEEAEEVSEPSDEEMPEQKPEAEMIQTEPEPMYFEEDAAVMDAVEESVETRVSGEIPEEDTIENIREDIKEEKGQGDYFAREAGVEKKGKPKSKGSLSMGFYDDK